MTAVNNEYTRLLDRFRRFPGWLRWRLFNWKFGRMVGFFGTVGLQYEELRPEKAVLFLKNRKRVQNHIGTIHASATAMLAESASGAIMAVNTPDDRVAVVKRMCMDYRRRAQGDMRAIATLSPQQIRSIRSHEHGEMEVKVQVFDGSGREPVDCLMLWVWVPRHRPVTRKPDSLMQQILAGNHDNRIDFNRLTELLVKRGFELERSGSYHVFSRRGVDEILSLRPEGRFARASQVRQIRQILIKHQLTEAGS